MKKVLSILLVVLMLTSVLCGCSEKFEVDDTGATKIRFNQSVSQLKKLENKKVTISGYFSLLTPLDGTLVYLMNIPLQACPFCLPNSNTLSNTIAVDFKTAPDFTTEPVKVVGTLVTGKFVDDYGYEYDFRIEDAVMEKIDTSKVPEGFEVYYTLAQDDYPYKIYDIVYTLDTYIFYKDYDIKEEELVEINFYDYQEVKDKVTSYNASRDYDEFLSMWDAAKKLVDKVNENIKNGQTAKNMEYKAEVEALIARVNSFINKYEL